MSALVAAQGKSILVCPADSIARGDIFSRQSHAGKCLGHIFHQVGQRRKLKAGHRHHAHRLGAAGNDYFGLACHNSKSAVGNTLHPRRAETVNRLGGNCYWQAGAQRHHTRHIHALLALWKCAAQDDIINIGRVQPFSPAQQFLDHRGGHFIRTESRQAAFLGFTHCGARSRHYDRCSCRIKSVHHIPPISSLAVSRSAANSTCAVEFSLHRTMT